MTALTSTQETHLNRMNKAAQDATLGTRIKDAEANVAALQAGTAGVVYKITQTVGYAAFTDGGAAVGTYTLTAGTIPAKATVLRSAVTAITGFAGDTSAALTIGDGTDVDRYNTSTINVFATAANGADAGDPSGTKYHVAGKSVVLTITSATDWGAVNAGSVTVAIYYVL